MKISAIIPTNRGREEELEKILAYVEPYFDEVIIQKDIGNRIYTRYEGIKRAKNEVIYTQDDDCIVNNIKEIIENYEEGVITTNSLVYNRSKYEGTGICLVGYGAIFDRYLIGKMEDFRVWLEDDNLFNRECDRVFTYLNKKKIIDSNFTNFPSAFHGISAKVEHEAYFNRIKEKLNEYTSLHSN